MPSADRERKTSWSQGQILTPEAALALHLVTDEELASRFPLIITHDCDLAATLDRDPSAEILIGRSIGPSTNWGRQRMPKSLVASSSPCSVRRELEPWSC